MYLHESFGKNGFGLGFVCLVGWLNFFFKLEMRFSVHDVFYLEGCSHILNAILPLQLNLNNIICHLRWKRGLVLPQEELFYMY